MEDREKLLQELSDIGQQYQKVMKEVEDGQETYWNSLSKDDQLKCFCAVTRRIYQGEIIDRGSYRWVLYDVFGFGPESYMSAQDAGYLTIHNSIMGREEERDLLLDFARKSGIENPEDSVSNYYKNTC